jgi:hypothetical protein
LLVLVALTVMLAGLTALAAVRPWIGLALLLALLPFNGLLLDVVAPTVRLSATATTALAAWHDALAVGVMVAGAWSWIRSRPRRLSGLQAATAVVLASAAISLALAPHLQTGLYAFRTLYEPICLAVAVVALAKARGLPARLSTLLPTVVVASAIVAALFAVWQVYVGGYHYLMTFQVRDGRLPSAYLAAFVNQPRAFGTLHSPNEFGAFLAVAVILVLVPGIVRFSGATRAWLAGILAFAQLLSFSRSSWLSLGVALLVTLALLPATLTGVRYVIGELRRLVTWRRFGPPAVVFVVLVAAVVVSSGATRFARGTISGQDPSSAEHASQFGDLLPGVSIDSEDGSTSASTARSGLFGLGLGAAGPKSTRFEGDAEWRRISSEAWYVNYQLQTGYVGLGALLVLLIVCGRGLWQRRRHPLPRAALAIGLGLMVGALFIPVLDEPALAVPVWTLIGLGLAQPRFGAPGDESATVAVITAPAGV